jgi:hypothetical protein
MCQAGSGAGGGGTGAVPTLEGAGPRSAGLWAALGQLRAQRTRLQTELSEVMAQERLVQQAIDLKRAAMGC